MSNVKEQTENAENFVSEMPLDPNKVAELETIEAKYVMRRQACEMLGIRVTNTAKALDDLAGYVIYDRIVYVREDVEALANERMSKNAERNEKRQQALEKMQENLRKQQERADALAKRIQAAQNGTSYAKNPITI